MIPITRQEALKSGLKRYFTGKPCYRGGTNTDGNVQLLCPTCNLSKGVKTMKEWKGY